MGAHVHCSMATRATLTLTILAITILAGLPSLYYATAIMLRAIHTTTPNTTPTIHTLPPPNLPQ